MKSKISMAMLAGLSGFLAGGVPPLSTQHKIASPTRKRNKESVEETIKKAEEKRARKANKRAFTAIGKNLK